MDVVVTPERRQELRVRSMQAELEHNQAGEAERQLADVIITEMTSALSASDMPGTNMRPIYYRADTRTPASVRVEALGSNTTTLPIHDSSALWGIRFTDELGETSSAIMFGRTLLSWSPEDGEFSPQRQQAPNMLSLWKRIQDSGSEPFVHLNGFNVVHRDRVRTDRIRETGKMLGSVVRRRWQRWAD